MNKELTYILGAGASYQSIPVVKSFSNRFNEFLKYLSRIYRDTRFGEDICRVFENAHSRGQNIYEGFNGHQSFDTYFKKLYHTGQVKKIFEAKKFLNLYFLWEHLSKPIPRPQDLDEAIFWKQSMLDKRYDALIAGLLKPINAKAEPYCPVNFLTWNYDLNLFLSLKNYFSPNDKIGDFLNRIKVKGAENIWEIENVITVINMNGFFYSRIFSNEIDLYNNQSEIHEFFQKKLKDNYFSIDYNDGDAELVRFAWELDSPIDNAKPDVIQKANEKITLSKNIIVVGYTFPLYNRLVDFAYFNGRHLEGKKVYIQDPNATEIKNKIIDDFNILLPPKDKVSVIGLEMPSGTYLTDVTNCDSFFVPSDIYKYVDSV